MTHFSMMWGDVEDPGASRDTKANADFIAAGMAECEGRIIGGIYGNEGSLARIIGGDMRFAGWPYWRASDDGVPDVNNVSFNGLVVSVEQWSLERNWNGVGVDLCARRNAAGEVEYGVDFANFAGHPAWTWFDDLWNDPNFPIRFIIVGDQFPVVAKVQIANAEATGHPFDFQLYTYFNMPGGQFYAGRDGAQQMREALDSMGVPQREQPAPEQPAPATPPVASGTPAIPVIAVRAALDSAIEQAQEARRLVG